MVVVILKIVILLVEFFGFGLVLRRITGIPLSITPPVIASIIILLLYFTNFLVSLRPVSILVHLCGLLLFLSYFLFKIKERPKFKIFDKKNTSFLLLFLSVLFVALAFFHLNRFGEFRAWDEFSHWGTVIRAIYEANTFILNPNPLYCQDYPPGTALFSYYILSLLGYSEGNAYFSFSILLLCYVSPLVSTAFKKNSALGLFVCVVVFLLVVALGNGWASVLIDHVLSLALAGAIISYFIAQKNERSLIFMPILLGSLVLLKHIGFSLAILAAAICVIDWLILRCTTKQSIIPHFRMTLFSFKDILWALSLFLLPFLVMLSWKYCVEVNELRQTWGRMSIANFFNKSLTCCTTPREIGVAGKFFSTFFNLDASYTKSSTLVGFLSETLGRVNLLQLLFNSTEFTVGKVIVVLSLIGIVASFFFSSVQLRLRFITLNFMLLVGALLYSSSLLLAYLYGFSDFEASILISFQRYHNVILLAWSLIFVYIMLELFSDLATLCKRLFLLLVMVIFSLWVLISVTYDAKFYIRYGARSASSERIEVRKFVEKIKPKIPPKARVYIDWYGSNGWELWLTKYELLPRITNLHCFSLGPKLSPEDMYTCEFQPLIIKDYDYLLIGKGLQVLRKNYGSIFEGVPPDVDEGLLKIKNTKTGLKIIYVPQ